MNKFIMDKDGNLFRNPDYEGQSIFKLSRKKPSETEWRSNTHGDIDYILFVLKENLQSPPFDKLEWKIELIK